MRNKFASIKKFKFFFICMELSSETDDGSCSGSDSSTTKINGPLELHGYKGDYDATPPLYSGEEGKNNQETIKERLAALMQRPDAIFELSAFANLKQFIDLNGTPKEIAKFFTKSYRGYSEMCKLVSYWLLLSGMSNEEIRAVLEDNIRKMIVARFNATIVDRLISEDTRSPHWLLELVKESKWRLMIYDLSDWHRDCLFLNYCIQLISSTGYDQEIAALPSASTNFAVYNRVLFSSIQKIFLQTELTFDSYIEKFCKLTDHSEHTYFYTQALIHAISEEHGNLDVLRISESMEERMCNPDIAKREDGEDRTKEIRSIMLKMTFVYKYPSIVRSLKGLLSSSQPSPADVRWLYNAYKCLSDSSSYPPARFIQKSAIFKILISHLFDPSYHLPSEFVHEYLWLLSYASTVEDPRSIHVPTAEVFVPDLERVKQVEIALKQVHEVCQKNAFGTKLAGTPVDKILQFLHYPIISASVMFWIQANLTDPDRVSTVWNTKSLPTYLGIWKEIVFLHPNQHPLALKTLVMAFEGQNSLGSVEALSTRKSIIEALVYLMQYHYVLPVMHQISQWATYSDQSLTKHFLLTLLPLIKPTFSPQFLELLLPLFESVKFDPNEHGAILKPFKNHINAELQSLPPHQTPETLLHLKSLLL